MARRFPRVALCASVAAGLSACTVPGMGVEDSSVGDNGSFEVVRSGLPVNWILSRYPVRRGDAEVVLDTLQVKSGRRSLAFVVHRIAEDKWGPPFLFQVRPLDAGQEYAVRFWLRNEGSKVLVQVGFEAPYHMFGGPSEAEQRDYGEHPPIREILDEEDLGRGEWRQFEYVYRLPETVGDLRFELKLLQAGTLWVDDVRIDPVAED